MVRAILFIDVNINCHFCGTLFDKIDTQYNKHLREGRNYFFCSLSCSSKFNRSNQKQSDVDLYCKNEKTCKQCNTILSYEKRKSKFCSLSCSASFNNKNSWADIRKIAHSISMKEWWVRKHPIKKAKVITERTCKICKTNSLNKRKQICEPCKFNYYHVYRPLCEFKFDPKKYPNKFDLSVFSKNGYYSPSNKRNNLTGVSRDHLYTVKDGFDNKIDPEIIKHPANCSLVVHTSNQSKGRNSSITLVELLSRIKEWS